MKNGIKLFLVVALAAIFAITACNKNKTADGGLTAGAKAADETNAGNSIRLSNVPVTVADKSLSYDFGYIATGLGEIDPLGSFMAGTPKVLVNNGRLTLELDEFTAEVFMEGLTPSDAKGYKPNFVTSNFFSESTISYSLGMEGFNQNKAFLVYVDKDVTISGGSFGVDFNNSSLKKGWNYVTYNGSYEVLAVSQTQPAGYTWTVKDNGIFEAPRDDITLPNDMATTYDYDKILHGDLSDFAGFWENSKGESRKLRADGTVADGQKSSGFTRQTMTNGGTYYMWGVNTPDEGGFGVMLFPEGVGIQFGNEFYETDKTKVRIMMGQDLDVSQIYYK